MKKYLFWLFAIATLAIGAPVVVSVNWANITGKPAAFTPPMASGSVLGGIKVGSGLSINGSGVLSASGGGDVTGVSLTTSSNDITFTGTPCTTGDCAFTINLARNLSAIANLSGTGLVRRTGDYSFSVGTLLTPSDLDSSNSPTTNYLLSWDGTKFAWTSPGAGYTDEQAQDAVGGILVDSNTTDAAYNDGTPSITIDVKTQQSITSDASGIKLSGDAGSPGNSMYYGTDGSGSKGYYSLPSSSGGLVVIGDSLLGSDTASVTFSSIGSGYKHLRLEVYGRSTQAATETPLEIQFNADTTSGNYQWYRQYAQSSGGGGQSGVASAAVIRVGHLPGTSSSADYAGVAVVDIPQYAGTSFHKLITGTATVLSSSNGMWTERYGGAWFSTSAINEVKVQLSSGSLKTGTRVTLYGLN